MRLDFAKYFDALLNHLSGKLTKVRPTYLDALYIAYWIETLSKCSVEIVPSIDDTREWTNPLPIEFYAKGLCSVTHMFGMIQPLGN